MSREKWRLKKHAQNNKIKDPKKKQYIWADIKTCITMKDCCSTFGSTLHCCLIVERLSVKYQQNR